MGDTTFKEDIGLFFKNNALFIAIGVALIIAITIIIILLVNKNKKTDAKKIDVKSNLLWLENLGGKENISNVESKGSRLSLTLIDVSKINEEKLKELGVSSIIKMSNKIILVVEDNAKKIEDLIK